MCVLLLQLLHELAGGCGVAALIALAAGWPVMAGPSWRWM